MMIKWNTHIFFYPTIKMQDNIVNIEETINNKYKNITFNVMWNGVKI